MGFRHILIVSLCCCWKVGESCYQSGWSRWINDYKPSTTLFPQEIQEHIQDGGGDIENMNQTERDTFCPPGRGTITKIECYTADGQQYNTTSNQHLECTVSGGFKCSNRLAGGKCLDYKIRLFCQCVDPLTTTMPRVTTDTKGPGTGVTSAASKGSDGRGSKGQTSGQGHGSAVDNTDHDVHVGSTSKGDVIGNTVTGKLNPDVMPKTSTDPSIVSGGTVKSDQGQGQGNGGAAGSTMARVGPTTHAAGQNPQGQGNGSVHNESSVTVPMATAIVGLAVSIMAILKFNSE